MGKDGQELVTIGSVANMVEAELAKGLLASEEIPCILKDSGSSGEFLRVAGWGSPFGVDVIVAKENEDKAKEALADFL